MRNTLWWLFVVHFRVWGGLAFSPNLLLHRRLGTSHPWGSLGGPGTRGDTGRLYIIFVRAWAFEIRVLHMFFSKSCFDFERYSIQSYSLDCDAVLALK